MPDGMLILRPASLTTPKCVICIWEPDRFSENSIACSPQGVETMRNAFIACFKDENGGEVVEYTLVVGLIVVGCLGLLSQLGIKVEARWRDIVDAMQ